MKKILLTLVIISSIVACSTDDITLAAGESFTDTNVRVLKLDTLSINFSTFQFDSIETLSIDRFLIGAYTDPVLGRVSCSSFMELTPYSYAIDEEAVYDSIVLILRHDTYFYNDTLQPLTYKVHEVTEQIKPNNGTSFYNTSTIPFNNEIIGAKTFYPKPFSNDSLRIPLSDAFGQNIFDLLQQNTVTNIDELRLAFKGLTIQGDQADNETVLGFSTQDNETLLRIYYNMPEDYSTNEVFSDIVLDNTTQTYFNNISYNRNNTVLENVTAQTEPINSSNLNSYSYIQSGTGLATKIEIPNIKTLYNFTGEGTVLEATLHLPINESNFDDDLHIPDSLYVSILDRNEAISSELYDYSSNQVVATLQRDSEFTAYYYNIPVTTHIDNLLNSALLDDLSLTLLTTDYENSVTRIILNDTTNHDEPAYITITYAIYNEED